MLFLGVDLAWGEGSEKRPANETGLAAITETGTVLVSGWARGLADTVAWIPPAAGDEPDVLVAVDAPLVVTNPTGQRMCERQVGQRYGRWQVSANTTNLASPRLAGVALLRRLQDVGFSYTDGVTGSPGQGRHAFECYPYTALVGAGARLQRRPPPLQAQAEKHDNGCLASRSSGSMRGAAAALESA